MAERTDPAYYPRMIPKLTRKSYIKEVVEIYEDDSHYPEAVKEYDDLLSAKGYGISTPGPVVPFKEENVSGEQMEYKPNLSKILLRACKDRIKNNGLAWREYTDMIHRQKMKICQQEPTVTHAQAPIQPQTVKQEHEEQQGKTLTLFELLEKEKDKDSEEYEEAYQDLVHMFTCQAVLRSTFPQANVLPQVTVNISKPDEVPDSARGKALYRYLAKLKPEMYDGSYTDIWREYGTLLIAENLLDLARKSNGPDRNIYLVVEKRQFYAMQTELQKKTEEVEELMTKLSRLTSL